MSAPLPTPDSPRGPRLSRSVASVKATAMEWLIVGYLAFGNLTDLSGPPGMSKSLLAHDLAASLSLGAELPGGYSPDAPMSTLIVGPEDDEGEVQRRLAAAGADLERVHLLDAIDDDYGSRPVNLTDDFDTIADEIISFDIKFVIFDNFMLTLGRSSRSEEALRRKVHDLKSLAAESGAAILCVRHWPKRPSPGAVNAGIGSIAITATARASTIVAPDPDDPERRIWAAAKANSTALPLSLAYRVVDDGGTGRLVWEGESEWCASDLVLRTISARQAPPARKLDEAIEMLQDLLADGPKLRTAVEDEARDLDVSWRTVQTAKAALRIESRQLPVPGRQGAGPSYWALAEADWGAFASGRGEAS